MIAVTQSICGARHYGHDALEIALARVPPRASESPARLVRGARDYQGEDVAHLPARQFVPSFPCLLRGARDYHGCDNALLPERPFFSAPSLRLLRGATWAGGCIHGTVRDAEGQGAARLVRLYDHASGSLVAETWSDDSGAYRFENLRPGNAYDLRYAREPQCNDRVHTGVIAGVEA